MSSGSKFTFIVEAGSGAAADIQGLQLDLCQALGLSSPPPAAELLQGGAAVATLPTIQDAQKLLRRLHGLNVEIRVVDPQGHVVFTRGSEPQGAQASALLTHTLIGGFQASEPPPGGNPTHPSNFQMAAIEEPEPHEPELTFLDHSSPSLIAPTFMPAPTKDVTPYMERLQTGELMLLDGSEDQVDLTGQPLGLDDPIPHDFAPAAEDEDLELADIKPSTMLSTRASQVPLVQELDPEGQESALEQDLPPLEGVAPFEEKAPEPRTPPRKSQTPDRRRVAGTSLLSQQRSSMIFGDWLHQQQRLRILIGFFLALSLGAIGPTCYSSSVIAKRITPQLEDLSTVKAHGHILSHLPNYRSVEEIEGTISSIKIRYGIFTILMWVCISGLVGLAWFRLS